jgi:hypothetical protein
LADFSAKLIKKMNKYICVVFYAAFFLSCGKKNKEEAIDEIPWK